MTDDMAPPAAPTPDLDPPADQLWPTAEFLDRPFPGGITLRAIVCPLAAGEWQWSILSLERSAGQVIGVGVERSAEGARIVALSELAKCFADPLE